MGDDLSHRAYRSHETIARTGQPRAAAPAGDPLAELARLIGQTNPFGDAEQRMVEHARAPTAAPAPEWTMPQHEAAPTPVATYQAAPQPAGLYEGEPVPAYLTARSSVQHTVYDASEAGFTAGEGDVYDDLPPPRRRMGVVVGLAALVLAGGAVAYGYHAMFGPRGSSPPPVIHADSTPSKIVPAGQNKDSSKLITERVANAGEKIVAREEKPVDISDKIAASSPNFPVAAPAPVAAAPQASAGTGVIGTEPRKVHTIVIRPDGEQAAAPPAAAAAPVPAAPPLAPAKMAAATPESPFPPAPPPHTAQAKPPMPGARPAQPTHAARARTNAPLSLSPDAQAPAKPETRVASVGPTSLAPAAAPAAAKGAYAVQVSSQRSEQEAQAAFHALQGKYPTQLGGKPMFVHKVELGAKGTYYRALVGPFASSSEAVSLCTSLKSAGGSCFIQRN